MPSRADPFTSGICTFILSFGFHMGLTIWRLEGFIYCIMLHVIVLI